MNYLLSQVKIEQELYRKMLLIADEAIDISNKEQFAVVISG